MAIRFEELVCHILLNSARLTTRCTSLAVSLQAVVQPPERLLALQRNADNLIDYTASLLPGRGTP